MIRFVVVALLIAAQNVTASPILQWDATIVDVAGNPVDPAMPIEYVVYIRGKGDTEPPIVYGTTPDTNYDLAGMPAGCNELFASARRLDTNPPLDSGLTEGLTVCDFDFLAPQPPQNLRVNITIDVIVE